MGDNSCNGAQACQGTVGNVGDNSCDGQLACQGAEATVGGSSCNGLQACQAAYADLNNPGSLRGAIGANSCDGTSACASVAFVDATLSLSTSSISSIGDNSCNGATACAASSGMVGTNSCNGDSACAGYNGAVGDCAMNTVHVAACDEFQPDGQVRRPGGALRGDDLYNTDASGQLVYASGPGYTVGTVRWVYIYVQNDGNVADTFTIDAADPVVTPAFIAPYDIQFFRSSGGDITAAVNGGTFTTPELAPGARYGIRARMEVTASAAQGSELTQLLTMTSVGDSAKQDTVGFNFRRR